MSFFNSIQNTFIRPKIHIYFDKGDAIPIESPFDEPTTENETKCLTLYSPIYSHTENVSGRIVIEVPNGINDWTYDGITCLCIGQAHSPNDGTDYVLSSNHQSLATTGVLNSADGPKTFLFNFENVDMPCETFVGSVFNISSVWMIAYILKL